MGHQVLKSVVENASLLNIIGLALNAVAAFVLIFPNLKKTRNVDDDYIVSMNQKTGDYTQKKHLREQVINIVGLMLLALGFVLQLVAVL